MMESTNSSKLTISSLHVKLALRLARSLRENIIPLQCIETDRYRARTIWRKCSLRSYISQFTLAWSSINRTSSCYLLALWRWYWFQLPLKNLLSNKIITLPSAHKFYRRSSSMQAETQVKWMISMKRHTHKNHVTSIFLSTLRSSLALSFLLNRFIQICVNLYHQPSSHYSFELIYNTPAHC